MRTAASGLLLTLILVTAVAAPQACVESTSSRQGAQQSGANGPSGGPTSGSGPGASTFDKRALLAHLGQEVIVAVYTEFAAAAANLEAAAIGYAGSLASGDRDALRDAWRDAMAIW